jgi:hypothetical protein
MKRLFSLFFSILLLPVGVWAQNFTNNSTAVYYYNSGTSLDSPAIDAVNFINNGLFVVSNAAPLNLFGTTLSYETSDTQNYTNTGTMLANVGFTFRNNPQSAGVPKASRSFYNGMNALVDGGTYLTIWATNIVNRGAFQVTGSGQMKLISGGNLDLSESRILANELTGNDFGGGFFGSFTLFTNWFYPEQGVYDLYWGSTNFGYLAFGGLDVSELWSSGLLGDVATAPLSAVGYNTGIDALNVLPLRYESFSINNLAAGANSTNFVAAAEIDDGDPANIFKQAVFVKLPDGFNARIRFEFDRTVDVELSSVYTNSVTGIQQTNLIYFYDYLANSPTQKLMANFQNPGYPIARYYRPLNYLVERTGFRFDDTASAGNAGYPDTDFFLTAAAGEPVDSTFTTNGIYTAYSAFIDNAASQPPNVTGGSITNLPGRVEIDANNLDLTDAQISAQGYVSIKAAHLISATNVLIDCDSLNIDVASTNGTLGIQGTIPNGVFGRLKGTIRAWSAFWTNSVTGVDPDPSINVTYHTLIIDATSLTNFLPVMTYDLAAHGNNVDIKDNVTVVENLLIDARSLTLEGNLTMAGTFPTNPATGMLMPGTPVTSWTHEVAPNLLNFTNSGTMTIPNAAHFSHFDGNAGRYYSFVNYGTIYADAINVNSWYIENRGILGSAHEIDLQFNTAVLTNSSTISSNNFTSFKGNYLSLNNATLESGGNINFSLTTVLTDNGITNLLSSKNGVNLNVKPVSGDLLSTTISDFNPSLLSGTVNHNWAGEDRGASVEGFINNGAIGRLILSSAKSTDKFRFTGVGSANAIYIDELDFGTNADSFDANTNSLNVIIDPNMRIYYAEATVGGVSIAEKLNGRYGRNGASGGQFIWVPEYAGVFSGIDVTYGTNTFHFNSALVQSYGTNQVPDSFSYTPEVSSFVFPALPFPTDSQGNSGTGFAGAKGSYNGLFYAEEGVAPETSGYFTAVTTESGKFSAKVQYLGGKYSFSGQFASDGRATNDISNSGLVAELQINLNGEDQITGDIIGDGWTARLQADKAAFNKNTHPATQAGKYTLIIQGNPGDPLSPAGHGYGTATVDQSGNVKLTGTLADGTKIAQQSAISTQGFWPLYVAPYGGAGLVAGWVQFSSQVESDFAGDILWIKPSIGGAYYPDGFSDSTWMLGSRYTPPPALTNGLAIFTDGNLTAPFTNNFAFSKGFKVSNLGTNKFNLSINPSSGLFKGTVLDPDSGVISFRGAILEKAGIGAGFFLGTDQSGQVYLSQP